jgi:hypothetical protein
MQVSIALVEVAYPQGPASAEFFWKLQRQGLTLKAWFYVNCPARNRWLFLMNSSELHLQLTVVD